LLSIIIFDYNCNNHLFTPYVKFFEDIITDGFLFAH